VGIGVQGLRYGGVPKKLLDLLGVYVPAEQQRGARMPEVVEADGIGVASFAEGRIGYREWARRNGHLGDIHSLDDRYDHDVGELMA
jgi:hypothetical protein